MASRPVLRPLVGGALGLLLAVRVAAHDFWIEPGSLSPLPGQPVAVRLLVGEHFSGEAVARPPAASLHRFVLVDASAGAGATAGTTLLGRTGADPAGVFRLPGPGAYILAFHGKPNSVELPPEKFNAYLQEEGLDAVLAIRAERGQLQQPGREIYSRCAKTLMSAASADGASSPADRVLGFPLELVAERSPQWLRDGEALPLRLLYEGAPLAGALVVARHRGEPMRKIALRSDAEGRVLLPLSRGGEWLVKAVHMRPAPPGSGADWESLWASLRFSNGSADGAPLSAIDALRTRR